MGETKNVVVGYDGSVSAKRALDRAAAFGRAGATVTIVTALSPGLRGKTVLGAQGEKDVRAASVTLETARSEIAAQGIDVQVVEGEGSPADVIIETATERGADLIVVGTRGSGTAGRLLLGSVSTRLVHHAPCDVLIVR
jgi:nucleotide-binding universal stress UspA family protein